MVIWTLVAPPSLKSNATSSLTHSLTKSPLIPTAMRSRQSSVTPQTLSIICTGSAFSSSSSPPSSSRSSMVMPQRFSIIRRKSWMNHLVDLVQSTSSVLNPLSVTRLERVWRTSFLRSGSKRRSPLVSSSDMLGIFSIDSTMLSLSLLMASARSSLTVSCSTNCASRSSRRSLSSSAALGPPPDSSDWSNEPARSRSMSGVSSINMSTSCSWQAPVITSMALYMTLKCSASSTLGLSW
mmetsp:Transcript_4527/g.9707  ORF Transcript_4527/g.9707 Transcript_4527/m.9707 type:complete len:238 (+) Transcript_4527:1672-2385(+)